MAIAHLTKAEFSAKIANLDAAISEWRYLGSVSYTHLTLPTNCT